MGIVEVYKRSVDLPKVLGIGINNELTLRGLPKSLEHNTRQRQRSTKDLLTTSDDLPKTDVQPVKL